MPARRSSSVSASHLKHLKLQGHQTKTVDAYARAIRTMGEHFDWQIDTLGDVPNSVAGLSRWS